ncbi:MAG: hypothetical protein GY829_15910 [Gammaproteobacteria bacterium]|nr:hypothetical protein [Gammaproteobacteria bacterium]
MNRKAIKSFTTAGVIFFTSLLLLLLSSCGFKLRGSGFESLEGQSVFLLSENPYGDLERNIRKKLSLYSVSTAAPSVVNEGERNGIRIINIKTKKTVISVDINGRPAEYETIITVDANFYFQGRHSQNKHLQDKQEQQNHFSVQRDYRYKSTNNLAHDKELEILTSEMTNELSQRMVEQFLRQLIDNRSVAQ